ncbi:MAG: DUF92 domain-containing protein [Anaerolineae bacterium]|nr:DUF92 domain-containing protein [Anaerolineae bacterium]
MTLGLLLAVLTVVVAYRARSLSRSGALAAATLGTVVFGLGGLRWAALLLAFFISSSALSRLFRRQKAHVAEEFSKGSRRDAAQVAANGGIAGLFVLLHLAFPAEAWTWLGFAGSLAAANADTWATELGVLSRQPPRQITTGKPVARGSSGAISATGTLAACAGSGMVALLAVLLWQSELSPGAGALLFGGVTLAGVLGGLVDSLLGATLQTIYFCPTCQKETERHPRHKCGSQTERLRGLTWLDNDLVNAACTLTGALCAALLAGLG